MNQVAQIGGPPTKAKSGWLKPMFPIRGKAHHFDQDTDLPAVSTKGPAFFWRSLCGIDTVSTERVPMFEAGNWDRCKKCEQAIARRAAA